jgi:hypothetical protein
MEVAVFTLSALFLARSLRIGHEAFPSDWVLSGECIDPWSVTSMMQKTRLGSTTDGPSRRSGSTCYQ